jgi:hypothetical protein
MNRAPTRCHNPGISNVEQGIMNIEVYFLVRNSEFNIRYSIFKASVFKGAMNRAPTDTEHRHGHVIYPQSDKKTGHDIVNF